MQLTVIPVNHFRHCFSFFIMFRDFQVESFFQTLRKDKVYLIDAKSFKNSIFQTFGLRHIQTLLTMFQKFCFLYFLLLKFCISFFYIFWIIFLLWYFCGLFLWFFSHLYFLKFRIGIQIFWIYIFSSQVYSTCIVLCNLRLCICKSEVHFWSYFLYMKLKIPSESDLILMC